MFVQPILNYFTGYVKIKVEGLFLERFINICVSKKILLMDIKREKSTIMYANVGIADYKKLIKEKKSNTKSNTDLQKKISEYIKENIKTIDQTTVLIFIEEELIKCDLTNTIQELGEVCNFERLKPIELKKRLTPFFFKGYDSRSLGRV